MTSPLYFSVVVPTYTRWPMLQRVLDALSKQVEAPLFEVVVVDDGSKDETRTEMTRLASSSPFPFALQFLTQQNEGPGSARNRGIAASTGRFIVSIGDDTVPEPRFLAEHARIHRDSGDDSWVACLGYTGWPETEHVTAFMDYINDYGLQFGYRLIEHGSVVPFNFFYTSNLSIDRELLAANPFDTSFPSAAWEDIELAYRLDRLGLKLHYNAHAVTRHYHPMTIDSFAKRQYTVGKSGAIFHRMHPELGHFLGVHELDTRPAASHNMMTWLRLQARAGETFRSLARKAVFETLMREHYLRGLRDGLREEKAGLG